MPDRPPIVIDLQGMTPAGAQRFEALLIAALARKGAGHAG
jgi:hypothetical protein